MSKQITIRVPDDMYEELETLSKESLRPLATEVLYQTRLGMRSLMYKDLTPKKATPKQAMEFTKATVEESDYSEVIEKVGNSLEQELDYESQRELSSKVHEAGLVWNAQRRKLEKKESSGKFKLIHQF